MKNASREYRTWQSLKGRCLNPKDKAYHLYGGRGIKVCDRWVNSYKNFLEDMGAKPQDKVIDRIDNDGDYTPENCRWATWSESNFNHRYKQPASGYSGINYSRGKWRVRVGGKYHGHFTELSDAVRCLKSVDFYERR